MGKLPTDLHHVPAPCHPCPPAGRRPEAATREQIWTEPRWSTRNDAEAARKGVGLGRHVDEQIVRLLPCSWAAGSAMSRSREDGPTPRGRSFDPVGRPADLVTISSLQLSEKTSAFQRERRESRSAWWTPSPARVSARSFGAGS